MEKQVATRLEAAQIQLSIIDVEISDDHQNTLLASIDHQQDGHTLVPENIYFGLLLQLQAGIHQSPGIPPLLSVRFQHLIIYPGTFHL